MLSVSLTTSRKDLESKIEKFEKEKNIYVSELEKLNMFKIEKDAEARKIKKLEKKARQRNKKETKRNHDTIELTENTMSGGSLTHQALLDNIAVEKEINDEKVEPTNSICKETLDTAPETGMLEVFTSKSEDPGFLGFPEHFVDWSEEQKRDAYDNNFSLYLKKWLRSPGMRLTSVGT